MLSAGNIRAKSVPIAELSLSSRQSLWLGRWSLLLFCPLQTLSSPFPHDALPVALSGETNIDPMGLIASAEPRATPI
jgi:hypothetical protein